jgi:hypothetical protein
MARIKKFYNAPSLCVFINEGQDAADVLNALNTNNRLMIQNAVHYAERNLEADALPVLNDVLGKLGGPMKAVKAPKEAKEWKARVAVKFADDISKDVKNLVLGYCNTKGGLLNSNPADNSFEYGFSAEHAKYIIEKMTSTDGITIGLVK